MNAAITAFKNRLVGNVREVWQHWSLRLGAFGTAFVAWFVASPEMAVQAWAMLPVDIKNLLPPEIVGYFGIGLLVLGLLAKFVKQRKLPSNQE